MAENESTPIPTPKPSPKVKVEEKAPEPEVVSDPIVKIKVMWPTKTFTVGEHTVTREGIDVPLSVARDIESRCRKGTSVIIEDGVN